MNLWKPALVTLGIVAITSSATAFAAPSAQELYLQGKAAYDTADYSTAIAKWQESYKQSRLTELLFNLAQARRLSGDCNRALSTYRHFVAVDPTADKRLCADDPNVCADDLIVKLNAQCGEATPSASSSSGRTEKIAGIATGGTGVILFAAGLEFGHSASTLADEVSNACASTCDWSAQKGKDASGHRDAVIGYTLDVVGLLAIVTGAGLYYLGNRESQMKPMSVGSVGIQVRENGATLSWSGSW